MHYTYIIPQSFLACQEKITRTEKNFDIITNSIREKVNEMGELIDIGESLRRIRKKHKYKQEYIAKVLNVSQAIYSRYETNVITPPLDKIILLANLYECSLDKLIGRNVKKER